MANVLTWRNVDAPQGGNGAIQGLATAAQLLQGSSDGLSNALGTFGQAQTQHADDAAVQAASRYQTAAGLSGALADGSLLQSLQGMGLDPSKVNAATIGSIQKGVGDLTNNNLHSAEAIAAQQKGQYDAARMLKSNFDLGVSAQNQSGLDGIRAQQNEIRRQAGLGNQDAVQKLTNDPAYIAARAAVDPKDLAALDADVGNGTGKFLSNSTAANDLQTNLQTRANTLGIQAGVQQALNHAPTDNQGLSDWIAQQHFSPAIEAGVREGVNATKKYNVSVGPAGSDVVGGGASSSPGSGGAPAGSGTAMAPSDFIAKYSGAANAAAKETGVSPDAILGQWGLETGWGKSIIPGTNNLGNIKDFSGGGVAAKDNQNGSVDKYRQYASPEDFAKDWVSNVKKNWGGATGTGNDVAAFAAGLRPGQQGGYAQDPNYASKLINSAAMVSRARNGAPALPPTIDANGNEVAAAPIDATPAAPVAGAAIQGTDPTAAPDATPNGFPTLDQLLKDKSASGALNAGTEAGAAMRQNQNIADTGIDAPSWVNALKDKTTSAQAVAHDVVSKSGQLAGQDENRVQRMIEQIVDSTKQTDDKGNVTSSLTAAAAGQLLKQGAGVLKSGGFLASTFGKFGDSTRLPSGQNIDMNAVQNLVGSIKQGDIQKGVTIATANDQAQSGLTSAQKALDDAAASVQSVIKQEQDTGKTMDPGLKLRLNGAYQRALERRNAALAKLSSLGNQQRDVPQAVVGNQAVVTKRANAQAALDAFDPSKLPLDPTSF